jgi:F-type H+-transporting ATPase subunit delta
MSVTRIATRYAKSLIELAIEQGTLEQVYSDITLVNQAVTNRDLYLMLKSPIIHGDKKDAVLEAIFSNKVGKLMMAYLRLLVNKGREMYIPEIAQEFDNQYKVLKKITSIRVTTAAPLSPEVLDDLRKKILATGVTTENLDIETNVDAKLIGGFLLEFDNKRYDSSVAHKLEALKSQFSANLYIKEF